MKDEDKKKFLEDFKKADITKKLDMWYYALDQVSLWEESIAEMSNIAQIASMKKGQIIKKEE
jgi:hypothetical protein